MDHQPQYLFALTQEEARHLQAMLGAEGATARRAAASKTAHPDNVKSWTRRAEIAEGLTKRITRLLAQTGSYESLAAFAQAQTASVVGTANGLRDLKAANPAFDLPSGAARCITENPCLLGISVFEIVTEVLHPGSFAATYATEKTNG